MWRKWYKSVETKTGDIAKYSYHRSADALKGQMSYNNNNKSGVYFVRRNPNNQISDYSTITKSSL